MMLYDFSRFLCIYLFPISFYAAIIIYLFTGGLVVRASEY